MTESQSGFNSTQEIQLIYIAGIEINHHISSLMVCLMVSMIDAGIGIGRGDFVRS